MRIDLPRPCRGIGATFLGVEGGHGTERRPFIAGNIEDDDMVVGARPHGEGTLVNHTPGVDLPARYPDWVLGTVRMQFLQHVVREIVRHSV